MIFGFAEAAIDITFSDCWLLLSQIQFATLLYCAFASPASFTASMAAAFAVSVFAFRWYITGFSRFRFHFRLPAFFLFSFFIGMHFLAIFFHWLLHISRARLIRFSFRFFHHFQFRRAITFQASRFQYLLWAIIFASRFHWLAIAIATPLITFSSHFHVFRLFSIRRFHAAIAGLRELAQLSANSRFSYATPPPFRYFSLSFFFKDAASPPASLPRRLITASAFTFVSSRR